MDSPRYLLQDTKTGKFLFLRADFSDPESYEVIWVESKEAARVFDDLPELFSLEDLLEIELEEVLTMPVYYDTLQSIYDFSPPQTSSSHASDDKRST